MRYEEASSRISMAATGVYVAYPTSAQLKPIYRGYKTLVNCDDTKVGIAQDSFASRAQQYDVTFQSELVFYPLVELPSHTLTRLEARLLAELLRRYTRSGHAREWFRTTERQAIAEMVWTLSTSA